MHGKDVVSFCRPRITVTYIKILAFTDERKIIYKVTLMDFLQMTKCIMFKMEVRSRTKFSLLTIRVFSAQVLRIILARELIYL
jgi:hypothetical protein